MLFVMRRLQLVGQLDNMEYKSNSKELLVRLKLIRANIAAGFFSDALVAGLNAGMGLMKRRIFNQSLDAKGESLAQYVSKGYKRKRELHGRQVSVKDLEFDGTLRRAIEVVTVNNTKAQIRITSPEMADIALYQEMQIYNIRTGAPPNQVATGKAPIFQLSDDERDVVKTTTRELLNQKFNF